MNEDSIFDPHDLEVGGRHGSSEPASRGLLSLLLLARSEAMVVATGDLIVATAACKIYSSS